MFMWSVLSQSQDLSIEILNLKMSGPNSDKNTFPIVIKWSGEEHLIEDVLPHETIGYLKDVIHKKTNVKPERQKLVGLKSIGNNLIVINYILFLFLFFNR